jgi:putative phosphoesterase
MAGVILGILSDTHGRIATAAAAVERLTALGCDHFLHCGDVGDGVLDLLPAGRSTFVFGNCDFEHTSLRCVADEFDIACLGGGGVLTFDDVGVAVTHGDDRQKVRELLADPAVRYLFTGHTHVPHDRREGRVRWINPGALHRAARKTVATLDLATDELTYHEIAPTA